MKVNSLLVHFKRRLKFTLFGGLLVLFNFTVLMAQDITVTGKVTSSEDGSAIPGANVIIRGTTTGTATDFDGNYSLSVPSSETVLLFSYIGFTTTEMVVGNQSVINMSLEPDVTQLSEVVVTAFGIEKDKKELTYAAQNVSTDEISQAREMNVINSLAGKVAGLDVTKSSAGVGSSSRVLLRGNRSIAGNNQPLYIVDGVPISNGSGGTPSSEGGGVQRSDGISNINPDDIASVTVLKGPNATALYGARAANGAIVITTKKGTGKKGIGVEFNTNISMDKALILTKFQKEYGQGSAGNYISNSEFAWGPKYSGQMVDHWSPNPNFEGPSQYAFNYNDNFKDFFETGYNLANSLTLTGGGDKINALFSYANTISQGIVSYNKMKRNNFNLRVNGNLSSKLSFDAKLTYINQTVDNRMATGDNFNNPMRAIYRQPGNISLEQAKEFEYFDNAGTRLQHYWNPHSNGGENVYWMLNRTEREEIRDRVIGMGSMRYKFTDNLSLMIRSSFDQIYDDWSYKQYNDTYTIADDGNLSLDNRSSLEVNNDFLLNYNNMWGGDTWSLDISLGGNMLYQGSKSLNTRTNRLLKPNLFVITNTSQIRSSQGGGESQLNSLYAFATLGFKSFLFLDITGRNDWSSTLPSTNWSYFYPSVGLNWVITDMLNSTSSFLSFAKVRANYAEVGGTTGPYRLDKTFSFGAGGNLGYSWRSSTLPEENLKPENTKSTELGFDVKFWNGRLGIDFTWYKSNTFNQLLSIPLPRPSGYRAKFINAGNVQNKGMELTLTATPVETANFTWDLAFNYASNESEVIELTEELSEYTIRGRSWMTTIKVVEGEPYGEIFTKGFVRNDAGDILINDLGLPITTAGQTVPMGNYNPDWFGGLSNTFTYKGVNLSILLDMRMGGNIFSFTEANLASDGFSEITVAGRDGFVVEGVNESDGQPNTTTVTSEAYWQSLGGRNTPTGEPFGYDASYVRVREVLLGYTFNFESSVLQSLQLALTGRNLGFLYNAAEVVDPNMTVGTGNIQGMEGFGVPSTSSYGFNARFKF